MEVSNRRPSDIAFYLKTPNGALEMSGECAINEDSSGVGSETTSCSTCSEALLLPKGRVLENWVDILQTSVSELNEALRLVISRRECSRSAVEPEEEAVWCLWQTTKILKLFVIVSRLDCLAEAIETSYDDGEGNGLADRTPSFGMGSETPLSLFQRRVSSYFQNLLSVGLSETDRTRFLFLRSRPFRVLLAVSEWAEWVNRWEKPLLSLTKNEGGGEPRAPAVSSPRGHLRYTETLLQLGGQPGMGGRCTRSQIYHLDLPFVRRVVPSGASSYGVDAAVTPKDAERASLFFKGVWRLLTCGNGATVAQFAEHAGEPWIETLIAGQVPETDPESCASLAYDAALNTFPDAVVKLLNREREIWAESVCAVQGGETLDDSAKGLFLGSSSWLYTVIFSTSTDIIRVNPKKCEAEEFVIGNRSRALFLKTAEMAVRGPTSGLLSVYEKAFYGFLFGMVDAMLPVCQTWEEALWAHCLSLQERLVRGVRGHSRSVWDQMNRIKDPLRLREEFENIFQNIGYMETASSHCTWRELFRLCVITLMDGTCAFDLLDFFHAKGVLYLRSAERHRQEGYPSSEPIKQMQAERVALQKFALDFIASYKDTIVTWMSDAVQQQAWIERCDYFLCGCLLGTTRGPALPETLVQQLYLLDTLSVALRPQTAACWLSGWIRDTKHFGAEAQLYLEELISAFLGQFDQEALLFILKETAMRLWSFGRSRLSVEKDSLCFTSREMKARLTFALFTVVRFYDRIKQEGLMPFPSDKTEPFVSPEEDGELIQDRRSIEPAVAHQALCVIGQFLECVTLLLSIHCCYEAQSIISQFSVSNLDSEEKLLEATQNPAYPVSECVVSDVLEACDRALVQDAFNALEVLLDTSGSAAGEGPPPARPMLESVLLKARRATDLQPYFDLDEEVSEDNFFFWDNLTIPRHQVPLVSGDSEGPQQTPMESQRVALSPIVYYMALCYMQDTLLTLKDYGSLLLDAILCSSSHQPFDLEAIQRLTEDLASLFTHRFIASPHLACAMPPPSRSPMSPGLLSLEEKRDMDERLIALMLAATLRILESCVELGEGELTLDQSMLDSLFNFSVVQLLRELVRVIEKTDGLTLPCSLKTRESASRRLRALLKALRAPEA